jgi:hypothetical protein
MTRLQFLIVLLSGFLLLAGTLVSQFMPDGIMHLPGVYVLVLVSLMATPLLTKKFDVFAPVTLVTGMYLGFVLGAIYSISNNMTFVQDRIGSELVGMKISGRAGAQLLSCTLLYLVLGLIFYYFGYYRVIKGINVRHELSRPPKVQRDLRPEVYWFVVVYSVVGILTYYFFYARPLGGFGYLFEHLNSHELRRKSIEMGTSALGTWVVVAANLLWFPYALERRINGILFGLHSAVLSVILFFSGRIGSTVITFFLSTAIRYRYSTSGRRIGSRTYIWMLVIVLALGLAMGGYRRAIETRQTDLAGALVAEQFSVRGFTEQIIEKRNVADISILAQIIDGVPDAVPFQYGKTFLFLLKRLQVRALNQSTSEPLAAAMLLRDIWYKEQAGSTPPTILGEFYLNFGLLGIIGGMYLFGILSGRLYKWMIIKQSQWVQIVYSLAVVLMVMFPIKGESSEVITVLYWVVPAIGTIFLIWLLRSLTFSISMRPKTPVETTLDSEISGQLRTGP